MFSYVQTGRRLPDVPSPILSLIRPINKPRRGNPPPRSRQPPLITPYYYVFMLDAIIAVLALVFALVSRSSRLPRLHSLTLPLLLTTCAATADLLATTFDLDPVFRRWTMGALVLATGFLVTRAALLLLLDWVLQRRLGFSFPQLVRDVVSLLVYGIIATILLRHLGVEITGLLATSAVITVVVGLALQQTLGNLFAGLVLAWEQRLTTGAWIEIDNQVGKIEETGWRSLVVRTRLHDRVLIPNSDVAAARIALLGFGRRPVAVPIRLGVAYGCPPDAVKAVLFRVAVGIEGVIPDPPPRILTVEFADSAVVYECRLWTHTPWRREDFTDLFLTRAHAALLRAGMEIPFPQRTISRLKAPAPINTLDRRRRALARSEMFSDLPEDAIDALAESSNLLRFAPGEAVVREHEASHALYLVAAGEAVVHYKRREVSRIGAGDVFGEIAFLTGSPRTATVRASEERLEVIEVNEGSLRYLLDRHEALAGHLAERMTMRRLSGEDLRDESGAIVGRGGLVAQIRNRLMRLVGSPDP
jgi:small-conductance mechanosensitive channel